MVKLFQPLNIGNIVISNRIAVSPMCMYSANDGLANDWHLVHLGSRAVGGAGLVVFEATAVTPGGRISPQDLGLWDDKQIGPLKKITSFIHEQGSVAGIQLAHAGRKACRPPSWIGSELIPPEKGGWTNIYAPSPISYYPDGTLPVELFEEQIYEIINAFKDAASRVVEAGFKLIEIHAAHGYLIHEFLSPLANKRNDQWGGGFENRTRFLLEIVDGIRNVIPEEMPLLVRLSATDWVKYEPSWTVEDSVVLSKILKGHKVDLIDCSSAGMVSYQKIKTGPGFQVEFANRIRNEAKIRTAAVGLITSGTQANRILEEDQADMVFIGREYLRNPNFAYTAAQELNVTLDWPLQYSKA